MKLGVLLLADVLINLYVAKLLNFRLLFGFHTRILYSAKMYVNVLDYSQNVFQKNIYRRSKQSTFVSYYATKHADQLLALT